MTEVMANSTREKSSDRQLPPLPAGMQPLQHQVAGHKFGHADNSDLYGMLDCRDGTILKPESARKGHRERSFYELVYNKSLNADYFSESLRCCETLRQLRAFIPIYLGIVQLAEHPDVSYIRMKDLTSGMLKAHTIDVKIGAQGWAPDSSPEKVKRQKARCPYVDEICFQLLGAKYYDSDSGKPIIKLKLRHLNPQDLLHKGFYDIFQSLPGKARQIYFSLIIERLQAIHDWFVQQSCLAFYGSSVLIVYEGSAEYLQSIAHQHDTVSLTQELGNLLQVRMIDFVHVWETDQRDENYIQGVDSLINYIHQLSILYK